MTNDVISKQNNHLTFKVELFGGVENEKEIFARWWNLRVNIQL